MGWFVFTAARCIGMAKEAAEKGTTISAWEWFVIGAAFAFVSVVWVWDLVEIVSECLDRDNL